MGIPSQFAKLRRPDDAQSSRVQDSISATLQPIADALNQTPIMGAVPMWIRPFLLNGYADFNAPGGTYCISGYYKDSFLRVWSKGTLINNSGAPLGTTTPIMQFPLGFRPSERQRLPVVGDAFTYQFVEVTSDGNVYPGVAVPGPGSIEISFSFLAEQ